MSDEKKPVKVQVTNAIMHGLVQLAVWGAGVALMLTDRVPPVEGFAICGLLTGLGVWQASKGQPPTSAILLGFQAGAQALRHIKGASVLAVLGSSLVISSCGAFDDPGQTARDVTEHPVFRGTLGGLLGACAATQGAHSTWDAVCDGAQQIDAVRDLLQSGAGPAELPPDVAGRECVAFEDGTVECDEA